MPPRFVQLTFLTSLLLTACGDKDDGDTGSSDGTQDGGDTDGDGDDGGGDDGGGDDTGEARTDADGDGYIAAEDGGDDCDDADPTVHPDAEEVCNETDDDCDGDIDEDATDATTFYEDADGDGYGHADSTTRSCEAEDGWSTDATDCDDSDATLSPEADEEACDGLDNDCDGSVDNGSNLVPTEFATIQDAIDGLSDGAEICVEPGTYTEQLDLTGRTLSITSQQGAGSTTFDVGTTAPMFSIVGDSETFEAGNLSITGFTVTGGELSTSDVSDGSNELQGGFAHVEGGTLSLAELEFTGLSAALVDGGTMGGLVAWSDSGSLSLRDITVDDVDVSLEGEADDEILFYGGLVRTIGGELDVDGLVVTDLAISGESVTSDCSVVGTVILADDGLRATDSATLPGTRFTIADVEVRDSSIELDCDRAGGGTWLYLADEPGELVGFLATGNRVEVRASVSAYQLVSLFGGFAEPGADFSVVDISDNTWSVTAESFAVSSGALDMDSVDLSHATVWGNTVGIELGEDAFAGYLDALVKIDSGDVDHLDVRGNVVESADTYYGLLYIAAQDVDATIANFVVAGNHLQAEDVAVGLLDVGTRDATLTFRNGDIVGNEVDGEVDEWWGVMTSCADSGGGEIALNNLQFVDNTVTGSSTFPAYLDWGCGGESRLTYNNLYGQPEQTGEGDIDGADGNISADPLYVDVSSTDPAAWDLSLGSGSPAIDAGDPSITDADGSTSDLGAYGGPDGTSW